MGLGGHVGNRRLTVVPQHEGAATSVSLGEVMQDERPPIDIQSVAQLASGGRWRTEAMRSYDRPVLLWVTRGQGRLVISGRSCGYGSFNLVFLPPKTMHGFSTMGPVLGSLVFLPPDASFDWPEEPLHLRLGEAQLQRELTGMIDTMRRERSESASRSAEALRYHAGLLSVWLARAADAVGENPSASLGTSRNTAAQRLAEAFTALVERDFRSPNGVQHYARLLGVTPTHLSRACRQVAGRPALDFLSDRRHFEARRLLTESRLPVAEVARQSGFASPAYFTRAFRSRTGRSPTEFRSNVT